MMQGLSSGAIPFPSIPNASGSQMQGTSQPMVSGTGLTFSMTNVNSESVAVLAAQATLIAAQLREVYILYIKCITHYITVMCTRI
jgi:hypothetical protein